MHARWKYAPEDIGDGDGARQCAKFFALITFIKYGGDAMMCVSIGHSSTTPKKNRGVAFKLDVVRVALTQKKSYELWYMSAVLVQQVLRAHKT